MKRKLYIFLLGCALSCTAFAADFQEANEAYIAGDFETATAAYEELVATGNESADLYYNLGNSYYRQGQLAPAILNYERALKVDATPADAAFNLKHVQSKTVDKIEPVGSIFLVDWWKACYRVASPDVWAYVSVGLFLLVLVGLSIFIFGKIVWLRKTSFSISIIALICTIFAAVFAVERHQELTDASQAIVFAPTITIKSSPDNSGTDLFILHEGTKVTIKSTLDAWSEIQTEDGNTGWLPSEVIEII